MPAGETRVYAMPFATDKCAAKMGLHTGADIAMWQLSFPVSSLEEARHVSRNPTVLKATALARCGDWHEPIPSLLQSTLEVSHGTHFLIAGTVVSSVCWHMCM